MQNTKDTDVSEQTELPLEETTNDTTDTQDGVTEVKPKTAAGIGDGSHGTEGVGVEAGEHSN